MSRVAQTYLQKAQTNLKAADVMMKYAFADHAELINIIGTHLRMAVELSLRHCLEVRHLPIQPGREQDIAYLLTQVPHDLRPLFDELGDYVDVFDTLNKSAHQVTNYTLSLEVENRVHDLVRKAIAELDCAEK